MDNLQGVVTKKSSKKMLVLRVAIAIVVTFYVANLFWRYSGNEQWQPVGEQYGVQVFSKKTPGEDMLDFKGVVRVKSSLSAAVALFMDPESCPEWMPGCFVGQYVKPMDEQRLFYIHSYFMQLPFPFQKREAVLKTQFYQDPESREVQVRFLATPDLLPPNDCCLRVQHVNNLWRFKPVGTGEVEVTLETDADFGGNIPDVLINLDSPRNLYQFLSTLQEFVTREKYQTARFDFIQEADAPQLGTAVEFE